MATDLKTILHDEVLPRVEKPSRYLGSELNSVHKDSQTVEVRLALAFPDLYDLGLGNLGIHILYAVLNALDWCWCERVYAPAPDMEAALRERGLPMFAVESKDPLGHFDGLGFTLQSELTFTNILNILDLSGIPLRTKDRTDAHPLTFAGGPAVFNPEPLAPFMDFFVIGDGEDIVLEIAALFRRLRGAPRREKLLALAAIEGIYVPELYPMEQLPDGRILPPVDAPKILKRITRDLNGATFPTNYIVPFTQQVHDRVSLEVLRGCTQGCRFCQAGMTTRPVRERTIDNVEALMDRTLQNTGYEEVSLVSLSTCDYSRVRSLVDRVVVKAQAERVSVSLPSLRLDSFSVELADRVADVRRTGLTFAPEAASPRLRALINKWIPDEELLEMSSQAFLRGWDHVKLYFMIGLPTERDDDIEAIADLALRTLDVGRGKNPKAKINLGVSTFVPKPFTPFQWAAQIGPEETERRQSILDGRFRKHSAIRFGRHEAGETFLEGLVSRGDRRAADLIEAAFRRGARLDAWREHMKVHIWLDAIEETGFDVADALRERALDERLPWDHIDVMIPKSWFQEDYERAMQLQHAQDCRHSKCHRCGVIDRERPLCASMLRDNIEARKDEKSYAPTPKIEAPEPESVMRLRLRIGRVGGARYLSHLEAMNAWVRAMRRARLPMVYSQGFHAHPRVTFSTAPPVGQESTGDYLDVMLNERVEPKLAYERLGPLLPAGFLVLSAEEVPLRSPSLMSAVVGFAYTLESDGDPGELRARVDELMASEEIALERRAKGRRLKSGRRGRPGTREVDIRPYITELSVRAPEDGRVAVEFVTRSTDGRFAKPNEIIELLGLNSDTTRVRKRETFLGQPAAAVDGAAAMG